MNNIYFLNYTNTLIEKNIRILHNICSDTTILLDYIPNTNIHSNSKSILKLIDSDHIGTNIKYYFGFTDIILNNINTHIIHNLLCNILIKNNDIYIWSDLIIKYYNKYFNNYNNKQIKILNKLLEEIKILYFKITEDIQLLDKKKYDMDIINKSVYEYLNTNLNNILVIFFDKIHIFYILSICFSNLNKKYLLIYNKSFLDNLKLYLY